MIILMMYVHDRVYSDVFVSSPLLLENMQRHVWSTSYFEICIYVHVHMICLSDDAD
jgi:hypothetical protein